MKSIICRSVARRLTVDEVVATICPLRCRALATFPGSAHPMDPFLHSLALDIPAVALSLLFVSALVEYLFPPYPGDTLVLGGFLLAGHGSLSLPWTFAVTILGSIAGAMLAFWIGERFGDGYFLLRKSRRARTRLGRLRIAFDRYGPRLLLINRFLPGLRGLFLYLAGMNRMKRRDVFLYSTMSNFLWIGLIAAVGLRFGTRLEDAIPLLRGYSLVFLAILLLAIFVPLLWRRMGGRRVVSSDP